MSDDERASEQSAGAAEGASEGLGELAEGDSSAAEAAGVASALAGAASDAAEIAAQVEGAVGAARAGRAGDVARGAVGAVGGAAEASSALTAAVGGAVPEAREPLERVSRIARGVQGAARALEGAMELGEALLGAIGADNSVVEWELETEAYPDHGWVVDSAEVQEALNAPYVARVTVTTEHVDIDPMEILGKNCSVTWRRGESAHALRGLALKVVEHPVDTREARLTIEIGPAFALLAQRRNSRIFQAQAVPDILSAVLNEALGPYEREVRAELNEAYDAREHCLQFDETDLAFVERLMEEEGIGYGFEHDGDKEVLFLFDQNATCGQVVTLDGNDVPFDPRSHEITTAEPVAAFEPTHALTSTSLALRDFDWTQQGNMRVDAEDRGEDVRGKDREVYEHYPRVLTIDDYDAGVRKYQKHDADRQALIRAERLRLPQRTAGGASRVTGLRAGLRFTLTGHPNVGADHEYLLTRVVHATDPLRRDGEGRDSHEAYSNRFEVVPAEVPWRPPRRTPKPRIHSIQTAVVVGPAGEEIHTDEHGRIKIELHWDRLGRADERSSCWVRVQQPWAGSGWGFVFIPRIGMEVLVSFLDGDPDRPLVIGSVYNGTNLAPYALPDEKTKSTIKTNSSPGGGGFNELRFEDKAGSEEIFVHAQKDYNEVVEHDHTTTVHNNQTNAVDVNQTETVGGDQSMTVDKNRTVHIKGSQSVTIDGSEPNDGHSGSKLGITGKYKVDASDWIEMQAPTHIKLTCGGSSITIEPGKITLTAGGAAEVVLDANALMHSADGSQVFLDANALTQSSGGSKVLLDGNALVQANAGAKVLFDGNANMQSKAGSQVLLDGNATVIGKGDALVQGKGTATVTAATANLSGSGTANVNGGTTNVAGGTTNVAGGTLNASGGTVNISGGLVKIN